MQCLDAPEFFEISLRPFSLLTHTLVLSSLIHVFFSDTTSLPMTYRLIFAVRCLLEPSSSQHPIGCFCLVHYQVPQRHTAITNS